MTERLPAKLEATALMRQIESQGGFATVAKRGDPDRGALILLVGTRGRNVALIERRMGPDFDYRWTITARPDASEPEKFLESMRNSTRFDPDCWLIELDIADAEQFIAETIASA